jgi:hypothetical protein
MNLLDLKAAVLEAIDRKALALEGASGLRLDVKVRQDGSIVKVLMYPEFEFAVRNRLPVDAYAFLRETT